MLNNILQQPKTYQNTIDSHCHLNMLGKTKEEILNYLIQAKQSNVNIIQNICIKLEEFESIYTELIQNAQNNLDIPTLYTSIGLHPSYCEESKFIVEIAEQYVQYKQVNAIGECGLDYYLNPDINQRRNQQKNFLIQLDLASKYKLPVIIHTRQAEEHTYHYLKHSVLQKNTKGVIHCYTGSKELAFKMLDLNFYISFSGIITFKKKVEYLHEIIKEIPIEKILIETDAPYLTPEPFRGKINHPALVQLVCMKIAQIKNLSYEEVAKQTSQNYLNLFTKIS